MDIKSFHNKQRTFVIILIVTFFAVFFLASQVSSKGPLNSNSESSPFNQLEGQVEQLALRVGSLENAVGDLETLVDEKDAQIVALEDQVDILTDTMDEMIDLSEYISIEEGYVKNLAGPHIIFSGVNLHLRSGSGSTWGLVNGLGNLIIGYNEVPPGFNITDRDGSHNLVIGPRHKYPEFGGFVAGFYNRIMGRYTSILGGNNNTTSAPYAVIGGGGGNHASGIYSFVGGGDGNISSHMYSSVTGGWFNHASGPFSSVSGGKENEAMGFHSSVSGGWVNVAEEFASSVSGGINRHTTGTYDWAAGSLYEND